MPRVPNPEVNVIGDLKPKKKRPLKDIEEDVKPLQKLKFEPFPLKPLNLSLPHINPDLEEEVIDDPYRLFKIFLTDEDFQEFAEHTNLNAERKNADEHFKSIPYKKGRYWQSTCGGEIKIFISILQYVGLHAQRDSLDTYWNTDEIASLHPFVSKSGIGCVRFQQIQRYFKVSNVEVEETLDMQGKDWWQKVEPFCSRFRKRSQEALIPGRDVAIDELLQKAMGRSAHTLQIPSKAAERVIRCTLYACLVTFGISCSPRERSRLRRLNRLLRSVSPLL